MAAMRSKSLHYDWAGEGCDDQICREPFFVIISSLSCAQVRDLQFQLDSESGLLYLAHA